MFIWIVRACDVLVEIVGERRSTLATHGSVVGRSCSPQQQVMHAKSTSVGGFDSSEFMGDNVEHLEGVAGQDEKNTEATSGWTRRLVQLLNQNECGGEISAC